MSKSRRPTHHRISGLSPIIFGFILDSVDVNSREAAQEKESDEGKLSLMKSTTEKNSRSRTTKIETVTLYFK